MAVNISVDLEGLTWGELRQFVRLADKASVPDDLTVDHDAGDDCCYAVHGLVLTVPLTELAK